MFPFEKLTVWERGLDLADAVYDATQTFPNDELYGLTSQVRRSANSVPANIAEGACRDSAKEQVRYVEIAFGSLMETVSHLRLAVRRRFITQQTHDSLYAEAESLGKMLSNFRKHLLTKPNRPRR